MGHKTNVVGRDKYFFFFLMKKNRKYQRAPKGLFQILQVHPIYIQTWISYCELSGKKPKAITLWHTYKFFRGQ